MEKVIYQTYPHWYERMSQFVLENEKIKSCDVCFLGDSIVEMAPINKLALKNEIFKNRGIISDKTHGLLISLDDRVIAIHPQKIVIFIGSNDLCDGYLIKTIIQNYQNIITKLKENLPDIKIIISTITPPCYYIDNPKVDAIYSECRNIDKIIELNNQIKNLSISNENIKLLDAFSILKDNNNSLEIDDTIDGIHLSEKAYQKIGKVLKKLLREEN